MAYTDGYLYFRTADMTGASYDSYLQWNSDLMSYPVTFKEAHTYEWTFSFESAGGGNYSLMLKCPAKYANYKVATLKYAGYGYLMQMNEEFTLSGINVTELQVPTINKARWEAILQSISYNGVGRNHYIFNSKTNLDIPLYNFSIDLNKFTKIVIANTAYYVPIKNSDFEQPISIQSKVLLSNPDTQISVANFTYQFEKYYCPDIYIKDGPYMETNRQAVIGFYLENLPDKRIPDSYPYITKYYVYGMRKKTENSYDIVFEFEYNFDKPLDYFKIPIDKYGEYHLEFVIDFGLASVHRTLKSNSNTFSFNEPFQEIATNITVDPRTGIATIDNAGWNTLNNYGQHLAYTTDGNHYTIIYERSFKLTQSGTYHFKLDGDPIWFYSTQQDIEVNFFLTTPTVYLTKKENFPVLHMNVDENATEIEIYKDGEKYTSIVVGEQPTIRGYRVQSEYVCEVKYL